MRHPGPGLRAFLYGLSLLGSTACPRTQEAAIPAKASCGAFDHTHAAWTALLGRFVRAGVVDYAGLHRSGRGDLGAYLTTLESVCRGGDAGWTREQKLSFWINAYNAYTVKLILDHYPLKSIRAIGDNPDAAFKTPFIPLASLRGKTLSLNDIEHEILRKELGEARIHFAIVCASKSCPPLRSEAYRAGDLDAALDGAARVFVQSPTYNDLSGERLRLSSLFLWFRQDFERAAGSMPAFLARYLSAPMAERVRRPGARIEFLPYDWTLNGE
jgi:hypothetical protein